MKRPFDSYKNFFALFCAASIVFLYLTNVLLKFTPYAETTNHINAPPTCIVIDPGHGGEDGGASSYGEVTEKELNLSISLRLRDMLEFCGIDTIMTRNDDRLLYDPSSDHRGKKKSQDLYNRLQIARSIQNGILISIHMNAFPEEKYSGLQVYYSQNTDRSHQLANIIQNNSKLKLTPNNTRKPKKSDKKIYLLDRFEGVGVLVECGFMSNSEEYKLLCSTDYQCKLSIMLLTSISEFLTKDKI